MEPDLLKTNSFKMSFAIIIYQNNSLFNSEVVEGDPIDKFLSACVQHVTKRAGLDFVEDVIISYADDSTMVQLIGLTDLEMFYTIRDYFRPFGN
jgi:hypothetical protein